MSWLTSDATDARRRRTLATVAAACMAMLTWHVALADAHTASDTASDTASVEPSRYDLRVNRYRRRMAALIPTQNILQLYGGIGLANIGFGWDYGRRGQWETDLMFGFVPKYSGQRPLFTMTLKEGYTPWSVALADTRRLMRLGLGSRPSYLSLEPLTTGVMLNTVYGDEFWTEEPSRYPRHYYGFSSRLHIHIYVGQQLTYVIPDNQRKWAKSVSLFYELGTYDLKLISGVTNTHYLKPDDWLNLSFGLKMQIF